MNPENLHHMTDRRNYSRYPCRVKDVQDGIINDISLSGLRYETNRFFERNDFLDVVIQSLNGTMPLKIPGEIVRRDPKPVIKKCAYGVRFKNNSHELVQQIRELIKREGEKQLSLIKTTSYHQHRLPRYSLQFLDGIPTEVVLTYHEKKRKGRLINFNRFGVRFFLEGEECQSNGEIIEDLSIYIDRKKIYEGRVQIKSVSPSEEVIEYGAVVLDYPIDIDLVITTREEYLLKQADTTFQDTEKNIRSLDKDFKMAVSDLRYLLDSIKERLEKEQEKIDHVSNQKYKQCLLQDRLELMSSFFKKEIHDLIMEIDKHVRKLPQETEHFAKLYYHQCLNVYYKDSKYARRAITKPLGYAGDYGVMDIVYNDIDAGETLWEKFISRVLATVSPAQAVRNRAVYLFGEIRKLNNFSGAHIMSLACGPGKEVQMYLEDPLTKKNGHTFHLIDVDQEALSFSQNVLRESNIRAQDPARIHFYVYNIKDFLKNPSLMDNFPKQDLIYSAGLFDYLSDQVFKTLIQILFDRLAPGGRLIIGNFSTYNSFKFYMEYGLDWYLHHRDEVTLKKLVPKEIDAKEVYVDSEPAGINLFLNIVKKG